MPERYNMCNDQPAQIDCRNTGCKFHQHGACTNISPALTLTPPTKAGGWMHVTCWSFEAKTTTVDVFDVVKIDKRIVTLQQQTSDTMLVKIPEIVYQSWWELALAMVQKNALISEKQDRIRDLLFNWVSNNCPDHGIAAFADFDKYEAREISGRTGRSITWGMYVLLIKRSPAVEQAIIQHSITTLLEEGIKVIEL